MADIFVNRKTATLLAAFMLGYILFAYWRDHIAVLNGIHAELMGINRKLYEMAKRED